MPNRFRFTLGQLMALIALSSLFMAAAVFGSQNNYYFSLLLNAAIGCTGIGVILYNRRLSRWMWTVLAGYCGPTLLNNAAALLMLLLASPLSYNTITTVHMTLNSIGSLLLVVGLAMTFRDVRRRLVICENVE